MKGMNMRVDFPELEAINARARRERALAVHRLIIVPLTRLFARRRTRLSHRRTGVGTATP
jgi:hypothetical protein